MKKFLLSLSVLLSMAVTASAADIVEDFNGTANTTDNWDVVLPTSSATSVTTHKSLKTNITYSVYNCRYYTNTYDPNYSALFLTNSGSGYIEFTLPIECKAFVLHTSPSASKKAKIAFGTVEGETVTSESPISLGTTDADFTIAVPEAKQAAGTKYRLSVSGGNAQFTSITFKEKSDNPELSLLANANQSVAVAKGGSTSTTLKISGENLKDAISVTSSNANFTLAKSTIELADIADGVVVSYTSSTPGTESSTITFTSGTASASYTVTGITAEHAGTEADPLTVADVISMKSFNAAKHYVKGYIIGCYSNSKLVTDAASAVNTNIVIADAADETATYISVQLLLGTTARNMLNVKDNPDNIGQQVVIQGTLETYNSMNGVKNATYISGLTVTVVEYETVAAWITATPSATKNGKITGDVTAVYQNGNYLYIQDATASLLVYGALENTYKNGDVLKGITGYYTTTSAGIQEMIPDATSFGEATAGTVVAPEEITVEEISDDYINKYVTLTASVAAADAEKTYNATDETGTLVLYNQFGVEIPLGDKVTIKGFVSKYSSTLQLYVTEATATTDGVGSVAVDGVNAPAEYYNLQGVRVANPTHGLYIVRQGNKVSKVLVK